MGFNMSSILEQAKKVQEEMERVKSELANVFVTAESGGGMVQVTMAANYKVKEIKISDDLFSSNDKEMIQDLIVAAVNKASDDATKAASEKMNSVSSMLPNIPGLNF